MWSLQKWRTPHTCIQPELGTNSVCYILKKGGIFLSCSFLLFFFFGSICVYLRKMKLFHILHTMKMRSCGNQNCKKCIIQLSAERTSSWDNNSQSLTRSNVIWTVSQIIRLNADWIIYAGVQIYFIVVLLMSLELKTLKSIGEFGFNFELKRDFKILFIMAMKWPI